MHFNFTRTQFSAQHLIYFFLKMYLFILQAYNFVAAYQKSTALTLSVQENRKVDLFTKLADYPEKLKR